ncbi:MAG: CDP-alcohol phosphatidyltransferase family protein [Oscillospiraceae bacterium]|nr:CDP-alcohol phosphatidyltransferase family protein [Oscillospiraceae bacterium]
MKLRYIPNIITLSRVALTVALIFIAPPMGLLSFVIYCIAGFTDMIDGRLSRKIPNGESRLGAELDSFADMLLIVVGIFVLMPAMHVWGWLWFVVIGALVFKILSASISGLVKHKKVLFTHTLANKAAALFLFIAPILYFTLGEHIVVNIYFIFLISWVFLATVEESLINLLLKHPNTNIKGIWKVRAENRGNVEH